jgi:AMP deaminase
MCVMHLHLRCSCCCCHPSSCILMSLAALVLLLLSPQHEPEAAIPGEVDPEPFCYRPLPRSSHAYAMVDGVVRIWSDASSMQAGGMSTELFPLPGSAADFFTDMHRVLRYASLGPVKSVCHHRCERRDVVRYHVLHRGALFHGMLWV